MQNFKLSQIDLKLFRMKLLENCPRLRFYGSVKPLRNNMRIIRKLNFVINSYISRVLNSSNIRYFGIALTSDLTNAFAEDNVFNDLNMIFLIIINL